MTDPKMFKFPGYDSGLRSPDGQVYKPARDITNCIGPIVRNAVAMTENTIDRDFHGLSEDQKDDLVEILHTLSQFLVRMYNDSRIDNGAWVTGFEEMYEYIRDKGDDAYQVYGTLCSYVVLNIFSFIFTSRNNCSVTGDSMDGESVSSFLTGSLSVIPKRERRRIFKKLSKYSGWMPTPPAMILEEGSKGYLEDIKEFQKQQKEELENRKKENKGNEDEKGNG